jgi:CheY-like chemotaxis protein
MTSLSEIQFHLVDDNDIDIAVNTKLLQLAQISPSIFSYSSAGSFLEKIAENTDAFLTSTNVVLLDIMMPNINGFECLERLSQLPEDLQSHILVFMLSSSIDRNDIRRAESFPMVQKVLEKPLDIYLLKKSLEGLLDDRS